MTTASIIARIHRETRIPREDISNILAELSLSVEEGLRQGEKVRLDGLGTFYRTNAPKKVGVLRFDYIAQLQTKYNKIK